MLHSGYIGGGVLNSFLNDSRISALDITAYIRSEEKAKQIAQLGIKAVSGGLPELEAAVANTDIVVNCVTQFHLSIV